MAFGRCSGCGEAMHNEAIMCPNCGGMMHKRCMIRKGNELHCPRCNYTLAR